MLSHSSSIANGKLLGLELLSLPPIQGKLNRIWGGWIIHQNPDKSKYITGCSRNMLEITGEEVNQWLESDPPKTIYKISALRILSSIDNSCINSPLGAFENCGACFLKRFRNLHTPPGKIVTSSNGYYPPEGWYRQLFLCCSFQHSIDRLVDGTVPPRQQ